MTNPFRRLHWQLALLFALVATAVSMTLNIGSAVIAVANAPSVNNVVTQIETELAQMMDETAVSLTQTPPDITTLTQQANSLLPLGETISFANPNEGEQFIATVSSVTMHSIDKGELVTAVRDADIEPIPAAVPFNDALAGKTSTSSDPFSQDTLIFVPVQANGKTVGIIQINIFIPTPNSLPLRDIVAIHLPDLPMTLLASLLLGGIFGYLAARGLARRLQTIGNAATEWAQGTFKQRVHDNRGDEISELSQHLNKMASDLEQLVTTRTQLAALEERGRIARDLHDTVKQKVFATQMQLSSAELALAQQPDKAPDIIESALALNRQTQTDLAEIIHALRPAALHDKGLAAAIRTYAQDWSTRTHIQTEIGVQDAQRLPVIMEDALFRVTQEALANIEKHAQANHVTIHLQWQPDAFQLAITDDGVGFDQTAVSTGSGLHNMKTRVEEVNGRLQIKSQPNSGTILTATITCQHFSISAQKS